MLNINLFHVFCIIYCDSVCLPEICCVVSWLSLCISWCISSFHSRPITPSFVHPRTATVIPPPPAAFLPAGLELIVFALLINLYPPWRNVSHWVLDEYGLSRHQNRTSFFWWVPAAWALGEPAGCDWQLLRRVVRLLEEEKRVYAPQLATRERGPIWLIEIVSKPQCFKCPSG